MKSKLMTRDERAVQLIALVILAILSLCAVLPFVLIFIASFTEENAAAGPMVDPGCRLMDLLLEKVDL